MPIEKEIVLLTDGKKALKITGLEASPIYARCRLVQKETLRDDSGSVNIILKAQAYGVDADGAETDKSPAMAVTINGAALADGSITIATERQALQQRLVQAYITYRRATAELANMPTELIEEDES